MKTISEKTGQGTTTDQRCVSFSAPPPTSKYALRALVVEILSLLLLRILLIIRGTSEIKPMYRVRTVESKNDKIKIINYRYLQNMRNSIKNNYFFKQFIYVIILIKTEFIKIYALSYTYFDNDVIIPSVHQVFG